jgi:hypothetical protein
MTNFGWSNQQNQVGAGPQPRSAAQTSQDQPRVGSGAPGAGGPPGQYGYV